MSAVPASREVLKKVKRTLKNALKNQQTEEEKNEYISKEEVVDGSIKDIYFFANPRISHYLCRNAQYEGITYLWKITTI